MADEQKPHTFTRQELYDLVWSEPMRTLAGKFGVSDRGLAKARSAANIPVPEVGYWNKLKAGKKVLQRPLPPRGLHRAQQIRAYVAAIHEVKSAPQPMSPEELNSWTEWALAQADRIDPVVSGAYKTRPLEPKE